MKQLENNKEISSNMKKKNVSIADKIIETYEDKNEKQHTKNNLESLEELEVNIEINDDNFNNNTDIKLKNSKEIYLELFKTAKNKAKEYKKLHLETILEANKIKTNYLTDIIVESSDDEFN